MSGFFVLDRVWRDETDTVVSFRRLHHRGGAVLNERTGNFNSSVVPMVGPLENSRLAPIFRARSRILWMPQCPGFPPAARTAGSMPLPLSRTLSWHSR